MHRRDGNENSQAMTTHAARVSVHLVKPRRNDPIKCSRICCLRVSLVRWTLLPCIHIYRALGNALQQPCCVILRNLVVPPKPLEDFAPWLCLQWSESCNRPAYDGNRVL